MSKNSVIGTDRQKKAMMSALQANYGNVRKAAKIARISPQTHYRWLQEDRPYAEETQSIKDIGYKNVKDNLLEMALARAEKGDNAVLNQLMRIFFKGLPDELIALNMYNKVPFRIGIRYVDKPNFPEPGSPSAAEKSDRM